MRIFTIQIFKFIFLTALVFLLTFEGFAQTTITSRAPGGNWLSPSTWVGGVIPGPNDNVVVVANTLVTINTTVSCSNMLIYGDGSIDVYTTLNIAGNLSFDSPPGVATLKARAGSTVNVSGDIEATDNAQNKKQLDNAAGSTINVGGKVDAAHIEIETPAGIIYIREFRSKTSGSWNITGNWDAKVNSSWVTSNVVPGSNATKIEILAGHVITGLPVLDFASNAVINVAGTLDCGVSQLTGAASFSLEPNATLKTAHPSGLSSSGSIQVTGVKFFSSSANYEFQGASTGSFVTSPAIQSCNNLTINSVSGVNLSMPIAVNGSLNITGKLNIGSNILTLNSTIGGANATNGLVGSSTSELVVGGLGNLSLGLNQASADARTLKNYTQSRNAIVTLVDSVQITGVLRLTGTSSVFASGSNAYLRLVATSTTFANVDRIPTGASITGDVKVESWFTGGPKTNSVSNNANRGTRTLSSPVDDITTGTPIYKQLQSYMFITGTETDFDNNPSSATLLTYNEPALYSAGASSQYTPVTSLASRSPNGQGFFLYYRGNRTNNSTATGSKLVAPFDVPESFAVTYKGKVNQGPITINLSYTNNSGTNDASYNGYNLVGNPYPATIDWKNVTRTAGVDNMVSVIKPGGGMITYSGGVVINGGSNALPAGAATPGASSTSFYIQPGQGFYVRARAGAQSITFTEAAKAASIDGSSSTLPYRLLSTPSEIVGENLNAFSGSAFNINSDDSPKAIYLELSDQFSKEETAVVFQDGNAAAFETDDATYFAGSTVALSTLTADDKNVAINFLPELAKVEEIRLVVGSSASGPVKLTFTDLKAVGKFRIFLQDNLLDRKVDVKANPEYSFNIDKSNQLSYGANRFKLLFLAPLPPPVEITDFGIELKHNISALTWLTKRENNNDRFDIERSSDGQTFITIGQVKGSLNSQVLLAYSYLDKQPLPGNNYYRLKQIDVKGDFEYSETLMLNYEIGKFQNFIDAEHVVVYPNPASQEIHVNLPTIPISKLLITIFRTSGEKVKQVESNPVKTVTAEIGHLSAGLYILELSDAKTKKIIGRAKFFKN